MKPKATKRKKAKKATPRKVAPRTPRAKSAAPRATATKGNDAPASAARAKRPAPAETRATRKQLCERWTVGGWAKLAAKPQGEGWSRLDKLLNTGKLVQVTKLLAGLPHADEVPGFLDLRGAPIIGCTHKAGATWPPVDLTYAQTTLRETSSWGTRIHGPFSVVMVRFTGSRLSHTTIHLSTEVSFEGCDLTGLRIDGRSASDCRFVDCDLTQAKLPLELDECSFVRCSFAGADLQRTSFVNCDLTGCDFRGARLGVNTRFARIRFDEPPLFDHEALARADLTNAKTLQASVGRPLSADRRRTAKDERAFLRAEGVLDADGEIDLQNQPI